MTDHSTRPTVRLTAEQHRALVIRESSVALGAGAGCGKTTVLTERFLGEVENDDGRPLGSLVALTFTEKAARELRQRIRRRCRQLLTADENSPRWRQALRALEAAPIGTFHEFCGRLLREHGLEVGLDPGFAVLDDSVASSLRDNAVRGEIRKMLAERYPDLMELGINYGLGQIRKLLGTLLARRSTIDLDEWRDLTAEQLVERWRAVWDEQARPALIRSIAPLATGCLDLLNAIDATHPKLVERKIELADLLPAIISGTADDGRLDAILQRARIKDLQAKGVWPSPEIKEAVGAVFEKLRKAIDAIRTGMQISETATRESAEASLGFLRLLERAKGEYDREKARHHGLDFDDLVVHARDLLRTMRVDAPAPAADGEAIEFVLVDEFQDTDRVQSELLQLLGSAEFFERRLFVVGDPKQSIYRFRGADPAIFGEWRTAFPELGRLALTENFRSVPGIIHFVNALFADRFRDVEPENPIARLTPVRPDLSTDPAVTFFWAVPPTEEDGVEAERKPKASANEQRTNEAASLASWLRRRLLDGWTILDRQTGEPRNAHAGDVTFLFRSMTEIWTFENALADEGFDYHTIGGSAFYAQQEVRDVVNVLSAIEDPLDEVALAGTLRGPFFSLSDEGLFWMARRFPGGITEGLARADELTELTPRDDQCARRARDLLDRWRGLKDRVSLARLLTVILDESGFEAALACEFLGLRKLANTRKLIRLARDFDRQEGFTLADLVARMRALLDERPREEQAATTDETSPTIRLMSIHQAKGLEFPIVVLADLNRTRGYQADLALIHPRLGLVAKPPQSISDTEESPEKEQGKEQGGSLGWLAHKAIEEDDERKELLRLFYVAATRARDHLVLSTSIEPAKAKSPEADEILQSIGSCRSFVSGGPKASSVALRLLLERFDWQTGECIAELPEGWPSTRVNVVIASPPEQDDSASFVSGRISHRQKLETIEKIIRSADVREAAPSSRRVRLPRFIDLDPEPESPPRRQRLGRLIRAAVADRGILRGDPLPEACRRLGDRQVPMANAGLVDEALRWLTSWAACALFRELQDAIKARRPVEGNIGWTIPWQGELSEDDDSPGGDHRIVIRGVCDLVYRDRKNQWRSIILSIDPAEEATDRLRLQLAETALAVMGKSPTGPALWLQAGEGDALDVEPQLRMPDTAVTEAIRRWAASHRDQFND